MVLMRKYHIYKLIHIYHPQVKKPNYLVDVQIFHSPIDISLHEPT